MEINFSSQIDTANLSNENKLVNALERKAVSADAREELRKSARDFESIFVNMMLKSMRESVQKSGLLDGGNAEEIYKGMLDQEYSKLMTETGRLGLAETIERQLSRAAGWDLPDKVNKVDFSQQRKTEGHQAYAVDSLKMKEKGSTIIKSIK